MQYKRYLCVLVAILLGSTQVYAEEEEATMGQALLDDQKAKLERIGVDMNQSGKELYDTFTSNPQKVVESGCLDNMRNIGLDIIVIDPANLLGALYAALKDELLNQACEAATKHANKLESKLQEKLELPYGIASVEMSDETESDSIFQPNITIDNDKVAEDIKEGVLNQARKRGYKASDNVKFNGTQRKFRDQEAKDSSDAKEKIENIIDVDRIWGGISKEEQGGNND